MKESTDFETTLAGFQLEHPIMNGAGWGCKTLEEIETLARTPVSAIVVGSVTTEPRTGNPGNVYYMDPKGHYSLNSLGLPNRGSFYYQDNLAAMIRTAHKAGKPLILSIAGFSPGDYGLLAYTLTRHGGLPDMIEINLGCPNVWNNEGQQKPIASYEPEIVRAVLEKVEQSLKVPAYSGVKIAVKISPLPPDLLQKIAGVIAKSGIVDVVTATNTLPNGYAWSGRDTSAITLGLAGIAGPALKPLSMGVVKQLCVLLPPDMDIIAAGGILSGQDAWDYLNISTQVKAVQIVTAHANEGLKTFDRILAEFVSIKQKELASP